MAITLELRDIVEEVYVKQYARYGFGFPAGILKDNPLGLTSDPSEGIDIETLENLFIAAFGETGKLKEVDTVDYGQPTTSNILLSIVRKHEARNFWGIAVRRLRFSLEVSFDDNYIVWKLLTTKP